MNKLTVEQFKQMWSVAFANVKNRAEEFSRLDAIIGDGDHGEAIVTAMAEIEKSASSGVKFKSMLNDMAFSVMLNTSGSTSTLLGALLLGMSDNAPDSSEIDVEELKSIFVGGLESVEKNTNAKVGDKTMMDALIPAVEAIKSSESSDIAEIMSSAAAKAVKGADSTIQMKANFGRARNFGDKSIGSMDSGAASWSTIFVSFAQTLQNK